MSKSADAFRTISEVAEWLGVQTHVLRFWESKFTQVKPVKRAGGRRYYRPSDMLLLGGIRKLLHDDGLTIKGVQKILREEGISHVADLSPALDDDTTGHLDADLAVQTGADVEQAAPQASPVAGELDHAPEHSKPADPSAASAPSEDAGALPSFMRSAEPEPVSEAEAAVPRAPDVPTLTPELDSLQDAPSDAAENTPPMLSDAEPAAPEPAAEEPMELAPSDDAPEFDGSGHFEEPVSLDVEADAEDASPAEVTAELADEGPVAEPPAEADALPMFMRPPDQTDAPEPSVEAAAPPAVDPEPEPEPVAAPRPRIVDVPDDDGIDMTGISASALTKAANLQQLTPAQRAQLRPLVAQLTALRDKMVHDRQDPR